MITDEQLLYWAKSERGEIGKAILRVFADRDALRAGIGEALDRWALTGASPPVGRDEVEDWAAFVRLRALAKGEPPP